MSLDLASPDRRVRLQLHPAPSELSRTDPRRVRSGLAGLAEQVNGATQGEASATSSVPLRSRTRTTTREDSFDPPPDVGPEWGMPGMPTLRQAVGELQEVGTRFW